MSVQLVEQSLIRESPTPCAKLHKPALFILSWAAAIPAIHESYSLLTTRNYTLVDAASMMSFTQYSTLFATLPIFHCLFNFNTEDLPIEPYEDIWDRINSIVLILFTYTDSIPAFYRGYLRLQKVDVDSNPVDPLYAIVFFFYGVCFTLLPTIYVYKKVSCHLAYRAMISRLNSENSIP